MTRATRPPPKFTVSEWAGAYRYLSSEASAEPGKWLNARAPYQVGLMDALNDPAVQEVVVMTSAQVGKSETLLNAVGYFSHQDPSPMLMVQPTLEMAQAFSKDRLAPMIRDTPALKAVFPDARSRSGDNGVLYKKFPGGHLTLSGANSPASLASRPVRVVLADEVDRWPTSAGKEGDPLRLAYKRAANFWNAVRVCVSTPTEAGASRIERKFGQSDQRYYLVPCPHCGHHHRLLWNNVHWDTDEDGTVSEAVWMVCPECGAEIEEQHRPRMLAEGRWEASEPFNGVAGFHLSELYSPWTSWRQTRDDFLEAKKNPEELKTWVNTALGEVWHEDEEAADPHVIANRREPTDWREALPDEVLFLTAGVDVQDDRLEYEIVGWGAGWESWGVDVGWLTGNPGRPELWKRLTDVVLADSWTRADGSTLSVTRAAVDSGGHYTQQVYEYAKRHAGRVYAIKGMAGSRELASRPRRNNRLKVPLYTLGVDMLKELLFFTYLRITEPGPGFCHFPAHYPDEWFGQLTNERPVVRQRNGFPVRAWKAFGRNEALDMRIYAMGAARILNPNFNALAQRRAPKEEPKPEPEQKPKFKRPSRARKRRRGGFVTNY